MGSDKLELLMLIVMPMTVVPRGRKNELIHILANFILRNSKDTYRTCLATFTKREIDAFLPSSRPPTKAESMELFIQFDKVADAADPEAADEAVDKAAELALVPVAEVAEPVVVPWVPQRKRLGKLWRKLAGRKLASVRIKMIAKGVLDEDGVDAFTVQEAHDKVIKEFGTYFDSTCHRNMFAFFHRSLHRALLKKRILWRD